MALAAVKAGLAEAGASRVRVKGLFAAQAGESRRALALVVHALVGLAGGAVQAWLGRADVSCWFWNERLAEANKM